MSQSVDISSEGHRAPRANGALRSSQFSYPSSHVEHVLRNSGTSCSTLGPPKGAAKALRSLEMRTKVWLSILVYLVTSLSSLRQASADPLAKPRSPEARAHLERGNRLYTVRDFAKAIEEYKAGALLENAAIFQYNIAQAYRLLGQYKEAIWFYERFEAQGKPQGKLGDAVRQFKAQMRSELSQAARSKPPIEAAPEVVRLARATARKAQPTKHWHQDTVGWGMVVGGLAVGATASYMFVTAQGLDDEALLEDRDKQRSLIQSKASTRRVIGAILTGSAVIGIGAGAVRLALVPSVEDGSATISMIGEY